jgi:hypothetical protein
MLRASLDPRLDQCAARVESDEMELAPAPDATPAVFLALPADASAGAAKPYFRKSLGFDAATIIKFDDFNAGAASQVCSEAVVRVRACPRHDFSQQTSADDVLVNQDIGRARPFDHFVDTAFEVGSLLWQECT